MSARSHLRPGTIGAALALALVSVSLAATPAARAVENSATVNFTDCEVHKSPYTTNQQIGGETNWTTTLRLDHPGPIPVDDEVTVEAELGALPAGTMPESMDDLRVQVYYLELVNGIGGPLRLYSDNWIGDWDRNTPLVLPEIEQEDTYSVAGLWEHRPKKIYLLFTGKDSGGEFVEYSFGCDNVVNPQPILTTAVYDLSATPALLLDRGGAQSGQTVSYTGSHLLAGAPAMPRARASVTVAGISAGTVEVDDSGAVQGSFVVPAGLSGTVEVRVTNGARSAGAALTISSSGPGGIDLNNPATWHPNAQTGVVDGQAKVKLAAKRVRSGSAVKLGGSGYASGEAVVIRVKGGKGAGKKLFTKVVYANAAGAIKGKVKLKRAAKGKWRITAIGVASGRGGTAKLTVR
ncbi:hypothetical protein [Nocardioides sp. L-11A]|uniref:hypothetical protein n=1 Tax=Nocardioides sp. L-11A TaxID=3043848 RepID=UPI00249A23DC|nr:hypothetical protein QJ852_24735 [Nocardioides sp. L-11A]